MNPITNKTLDFLKELNNNNSKEWFETHRGEYIVAHEEMIAFAELVMSEILTFDKVDARSGKQTLYRIYRDVRFSKDKTPYKTKWGGYFRRSGEDRRGGFHFDIEPGGKSFVGGGFWAPNKEDLILIREQIVSDSDSLNEVISNTDFKTYFNELSGSKLKTGPKGFDKAHEQIELLKHKQFIITHHFSDKEVLAKDFPLKLAEGFKKMLPFFNVMTDYLTTDLNGISRI